MAIQNEDDKDKTLDEIKRVFSRNVLNYADILNQLLDRNTGYAAFNINVLTAKKPLTVTSLPTASAAYRGVVYFVTGASGVADTLNICLKSSSDTYSWVQIATG